MRTSTGMSITATMEEIPDGYSLIYESAIKHPELPIVGAFCYNKLTDEYLIRCNNKDYLMDYEGGRNLKKKYQKIKSNSKFVSKNTEHATIIFYKKDFDVYEFLSAKKGNEGISPYMINLLRQEMSKEAQTPEK